MGELMDAIEKLFLFGNGKAIKALAKKKIGAERLRHGIMLIRYEGEEYLLRLDTLREPAVKKYADSLRKIISENS